MQETEEIEEKLNKIFEARNDFFALLDELVPKNEDGKTLNFDKMPNNNIKKLYSKFYSYDYEFRKMLPLIYKKFGVKFDV